MGSREALFFGRSDGDLGSSRIIRPPRLRGLSTIDGLDPKTVSVVSVIPQEGFLRLSEKEDTSLEKRGIPESIRVSEGSVDK